MGKAHFKALRICMYFLYLLVTNIGYCLFEEISHLKEEFPRQNDVDQDCWGLDPTSGPITALETTLHFNSLLTGELHNNAAFISSI